ncbi:MAG: RluA family pseudouridine synthase [Planctomycetota bacterium]|nr:RluA family pseudouridine synthase [Planctomycetota bacterium]
MSKTTASAGEWDVSAEHAGKTICQVLREFLPDQSWRGIRKLVERRRVTVSGVLCLDVARRLTASETVFVAAVPFPAPPDDGDVRILHLDESIVVIEKPAGMVSLRHVAEIHWPIKRRMQQPSADESVLRAVSAATRSKRNLSSLPPRLRRQHVRSVHRLDRDTSGLLVFARSLEAEQSLVKQFSEHSVDRVYQAMVVGTPQQGVVRGRLVRDRGDGLRGSTTSETEGKPAATHIEAVESLGDYALVECRLETGRTHQIRIHLSEQGHPVCGDAMYRGPEGSEPISDESGVPRLALHARLLSFEHPETGQRLQFESALPDDLESFVNRLRADVAEKSPETKTGRDS